MAARQKPTGLKRLIRATVYSCSGLAAALRQEAAFRQEVLLAIVLVPAAFWVGESGAERAVLIFSVALVLIVELLNSAVEAVVDRVGPETHELSGLAKDYGSAAVLLSLTNLVVVWLLLILF